ncbi:putative very-long-chain 3-oxoacyl-CoA reductase [Helianthus annuus]|nr:putative very-long-chain 3-oxoacyl-CoA reductase [Helianthus annuus]
MSINPCLIRKKTCVLRNNAGIMFCPYQLSQDGIEMQLSTNHLGHFFLTKLLLDKMKSTTLATGIEGRIVNLSSVVHLRTYKEGIKFDTLNDKNRQHFKICSLPSLDILTSF